MHHQARQLRSPLFRKWIQGGAADNHAVVVEHGKTPDFHFQQVAAAFDQRAIRFQRLDQAQNAADVVNFGITQFFHRVRRDHGAHALMREQFLQQRAFGMSRDQVRALNPLLAGAHGARQIKFRVAIEGGIFSRQQLARLQRRQFAQQPAARIGRARTIHHEDQFFGTQRHRRRFRDVLQRHIENFAGGGITQRREQHQFAEVEPVTHGRHVDFANFTGVLQIDAIEDADRLGGDEVAARHPDVGARHRRTRQAHRQQRFDLHAQTPARLFGHREGDVIGDAQSLHVARAVAEVLELGVDLRPRAMHHHQPHAQRRQQVQIVIDADKAALGNCFATEGDDKGAAAKRVDVRRRRAEPLDKLVRGRQRHQCIESLCLKTGYYARSPGKPSTPVFTSRPTTTASPRWRQRLRFRCAVLGGPAPAA